VEYTSTHPHDVRLRRGSICGNEVAVRRGAPLTTPTTGRARGVAYGLPLFSGRLSGCVPLLKRSSMRRALGLCFRSRDKSGGPGVRLRD
jgi:hypothetical protein